VETVLAVAETTAATAGATADHSASSAYSPSFHTVIATG
jgi:hypothetical protein